MPTKIYEKMDLREKEAIEQADKKFHKEKKISLDDFVESKITIDEMKKSQGLGTPIFPLQMRYR